MKTIDFREKISKFKRAIDAQEILHFFVEDQSKSSTKETKARYWLSVFHSEYLEPNHFTETKSLVYSVIFLYDHKTGKSLCLKIDLCKYAKFFDKRSILVVQLEKNIVLFKVNIDTLKIVQTISSSKDSERDIIRHNFQNIIIDSSGNNYLACLDQNKSVNLIEFDFENKLILFHSLIHNWSHFDHIESLFVKIYEVSGKSYPVIVLKIQNETYGIAIFHQVGDPEKDGYNLWLYEKIYSQKLEFVSKVSFSLLEEDHNFLRIIYLSNNSKKNNLYSLLSGTIVPINLKI